MEASGFCAGIGGNVLAVFSLLLPAVLVRYTAALPADIANTFVKIILVELDVLPEERLICPALRDDLLGL